MKKNDPRLSAGTRLMRSTFLLAFLPLLFGGCPGKEPVSEPPHVSVAVTSPSPAPSPIPSSFNGERAMEHARKQIEFGPRPPDTPALAKTRTYIISELKSYGLNVTTDEFTASTPQGQKKMANIIGELAGETKTLILITSHYDTKFFKDMTFVGANDPAASVGTLLEIARVAASSGVKPKATYRFVFFDGEEAFCENWDQCGSEDNPDHLYGSRHYANLLVQKKENSSTKAMILLDMMGYTKLELGRDTMSTRWLQDVIWQTGRDLGYTTVFVDRDEGVGGDDHEPFLRAGIDSVDLIQLNDYQYWHTPQDTIDKISAQSMKIVGETILASLPKIADHQSTGSKPSSIQ